MDPAPQPLASAEFLAVDVETNGRGGDDCELTEVGTVLVGGGELHERWESLVRVEYPLSRGIERLTGITQSMVDEAPAPDEALARLTGELDGRVLVAHNASFDARALSQAFERAGLEWPKPPVLCTMALARRFAPLVGQRKLAPLAEALGIEVEAVHRALPDAVTCAEVFCALFGKLCGAAGSVEEAVALAGPRRRRGRRKRGGRRRPPAERPDLSELPDDPGVYIFRDERGRPLYVGKSVALRSRARSHFCAPAQWTDRADSVDYRATNSELGALVLENRLIKRWRPPGNKRLKHTDGFVYLRCRLDIPYPVLDVGADPAPGHAVNIGPLRGRRSACELADQLTSLFRLRHCGRSLRPREHPSIYGQMGRCVSPCLGDLDPNAYRGLLDEALGLFDGTGEGTARLLARLDAEVREASAARHYERAAVLTRRRERLEAALGRLDGILRTTSAGARLVLAKHPAKERFDYLAIGAGRVVEWGPLEPATDLAEPATAATSRSPADLVDRDEVDEIRIVSTWVAQHDPPCLDLSEPCDEPALRAWATAATGAQVAGAGPPPSSLSISA